MATTRERREAIRRAMQQARGAAITRREASVSVAKALHQDTARTIIDWLERHAGAEGLIPTAQLGEFENFLATLLGKLSQDWQAEFGRGLGDILQLAADLRPDAAPGSLVDRTLAWLRDYTDHDGLQLSDRIWRVDQGARAEILDTVRNAVVRGDSARQAAIALVAQGKAVPADVAVVIRDAAGQRIGSAVQAKVEGNVMRNALRVMRTEMNRAGTEAFVTSAFEQEDVAAVKFNLSPLHPRPDICDLHARANLHGMGAGVYPQGAHPYPAHPETLSYLTVVFADEITDADRAGRQTAGAWLRGQPASLQDSILGKHKGAAFREGKIDETDFDTPWRDLRPRIEPAP